MDIDQKDLAKALRRVAPAVGSKGLPIYTGVRLAGDRLVAMNGDMAISATCETGLAAIVPFAVFSAFVSHLSGSISLGIATNVLKVIAKDLNSEIHLRTLPVDPLLVLPVVDNPGVPSDGMFTLMRRVAYAASKDKARPTLTAICIKDGWIVATDSYRLAAYPYPGDTDALVPAEALAAMDKVDTAGMTIAFDSKRVQFEADGMTLTARQIEGAYPSWQRLIPDPGPTVTIDREALSSALARCMTLRTAEQPVVFEWQNGGIILRLASQDVGNFEEKVSATGAMFDKVAFSPVFLLDTLNALTEDKVSIQMSGPSKPVIIREGEMVNLLMPVRVS